MSFLPSTGAPEPEVTVTPLNLLAITGEEPTEVDLGNPEANARYSKALRAMGNTAGVEAAYLLEWKGSRVPRGATIGNRVVGWTQHGLVLNKDGAQFGLYERMKDFEGPDHESEMLVLTFPETPQLDS